MSAPDPVLMNDFRREPEAVRDEMAAAAARVFASGWWVLGKEVEAFEEAWAERCGARHVIGVANGLDALEIALRAHGIGPGDEVVTTPMTAFATPLSILRAGSEPVFADIDPDTGLLDPASVERCLSPRVKAVMVVHLYGQMRNMDAWTDLARRHGIVLIEDCAQSHLAAVGGAARIHGAAQAFSFYPTKNLGAVGDAGAFATDDDSIAEAARTLRNYGQSERYHHPVLGMNSRLDELQAAILSARLPFLDEATARRRDIAGRYRTEIMSPTVRLLAPPESPGAHAHHLFVLLTDRRDALMASLQESGVQSLIHYPVAASAQSPCADCRIDPEGLVHTQAHAEQCLSIPCHPAMTDAEIDRVINAVNAFS